MTDKQIIIDKIDVNGCECIIEDYQRANNFEGKYEHIKNVCELGERGAEYYNLFCKDNPNCYYKQLKRAERRIVELNKTIQAKEQECEELKEKINSLVCSENCYKYKQAEKLKQTLTEIKEIAKRNIYLKPQLLVYDGDLGQLQHKPIVEILQKISECEAEE